MRLREIRRRAAEHLVLLLEEPVALTQFTNLVALGARHTRLFTALDASLTHPLVQSPDMNSEVLRDLRERDLRVTLLRDTDHVIAELLGKRLGHGDILPGQPSGLANSDVTYPCSSPLVSGNAFPQAVSVSGKGIGHHPRCRRPIRWGLSS